MINVAIVDDNTAVRESFARIIGQDPALDLSGSYGDLEEALVLIPMVMPDVVVMDLLLGDGMSGIDGIRLLKKEVPRLLFLVYTVFDDDERIFEALCAGAQGYVLKRTAPADLTRAIRELCDGGSPMSGAVARRLINLFQGEPGGWNPLHAKKGKSLPDLSIRENEILQLLARGLLYKEIAADLFISAETVRKHVYHIYEKLHVGNRVEAINKYFRRT